MVQVKVGNVAGLIPNFVPNFAMVDVQAEREAASAGGYRMINPQNEHAGCGWCYL